MLFGHQNDTTNQPSDDAAATLNPLAVDPSTGASLPVPPVAPSSDNDQAADPLDAVVAEPAAPPVIEPQATSQSATDDLTVDEVSSEEPAPAPALEQAAYTMPEPSAPLDTVTSVPSDLLNMKQQALSQLSPLIGQLDQTPEEKFRTTMMMIQSTDNQALLKDAYEAAQAITDEKARAQALLDVVNEINYFTQPKN